MLSLCCIAACTDGGNEETVYDYRDEISVIGVTPTEFDGNGGELTLVVRENTGCAAVVEYDGETSDWITEIDASRAETAARNNELRFSIAPYGLAATADARKASIVVKSADGTLSAEPIEVTQTPLGIYIFEIRSAAPTSFTADGGTMTVTLETNCTYEVAVSDGSWITPDEANTAEGKTAKFAIAPNEGEARTGSVVFSAAEMPDLKVEITQAAVSVVTGIASAADLMAFAAAVNAGEATERWQNAEGFVVLADDIDMSGIDNWTPIGNLSGNELANGKNNLGTAGYAFTGKFDGCGHTIRNLAMATSSDAVYGLFGTCNGATVRNLKIDASTTLQVTNTSLAAGSAYSPLCGFAYESAFDNITVSAVVLPSEMKKGSKFMAVIGGIAGFVYSSKFSGCRFDGEIRGAVSDVYDNSLGSGVGGIVGFARGTADNLTVISNCTFDGFIDAAVNRVSGIAAGVQNNATIDGCISSGIIRASASAAVAAGWTSGLRVGGILGFTSNTKKTTPLVIRNSSFTGLLICDGDTASQVGGIVGNVRTISIGNVRGCGTMVVPTAVWGSIAGQINKNDNGEFAISYAGGSYASTYSGEGRGMKAESAVAFTADDYFAKACGNLNGGAVATWTEQVILFAE